MSIAYPIDDRRISPSASRSRTLNLGDWVQFLAPPAFVPVVSLHDEFSEYEAYDVEDWDGYGAAPISIVTVNAARSFKRMLPRDTPLPDIAPGGDGTVGFEWRFGPPGEHCFVLVDVGPADLITARKINEDGAVKAFAPTRLDRSGRALIRQLFP